MDHVLVTKLEVILVGQVMLVRLKVYSKVDMYKFDYKVGI